MAQELGDYIVLAVLIMIWIRDFFKEQIVFSHFCLCRLVALVLAEDCIESKLLVRPPGTVVPGGLMFYC